MESTSSSVFQPVIIHAKLQKNEIEIDCNRDILLSPLITLHQLYKIILISFNINGKYIEHYKFTIPTVIAHDALIETSFECINSDDFILDGFVTPIAPGVYIEHSHPHEPLPIFSISSWTTSEDINMSFRILRDEKYTCLDTIIDSHQSPLLFEFQYLQSTYSIHLEFQKLNLPSKFLKDIYTSPKIINKQGQFFDHNQPLQQDHITPEPRYYNKIQEQYIAHLCKDWIDKLNQERKLFLINMHTKENNKCHWTESTGAHCVYCHLY